MARFIALLAFVFTSSVFANPCEKPLATDRSEGLRQLVELVTKPNQLIPEDFDDDGPVTPFYRPLRFNRHMHLVFKAISKITGRPATRFSAGGMIMGLSTSVPISQASESRGFAFEQDRIIELNGNPVAVAEASLVLDVSEYHFYYNMREGTLGGNSSGRGEKVERVRFIFRLDHGQSSQYWIGLNNKIEGARATLAQEFGRPVLSPLTEIYPSISEVVAEPGLDETVLKRVFELILAN